MWCMNGAWSPEQIWDENTEVRQELETCLETKKWTTERRTKLWRKLYNPIRKCEGSSTHSEAYVAHVIEEESSEQ